MKIIHVVPFIGDEASGPAYSVPALCNALSELGCEIVLYTLAPVPKGKFSFRIKAFERSKFPHPALGLSLEMYKELLEDVKDTDIIHNHSLWMAPNILAGIVAQKKDIPFINAPRGTLSMNALNISKLKKKIALMAGQDRALRATQCFHATALHEAEDINKFMPGNSVAIIPNGIDIPALLPKLSPQRKKALFLGRIHPIKGLENLLRSWKAVETQYGEWDLDIVGIGEESYVDKIELLIANLRLERVNIKGPAFGEAKTKIYQDADLYILPSYSENFGMTVAEALSNGTPVITTNATPWKELESYKSGWCIDPTEEDLKRTLKIALGLSTKELEVMGSNGRKWMKEEYSWDNIGRKMLKTYQWMLNTGDKPNFIINE